MACRLDSAHAPRCLGLHASSVLLAELDAAECAHANSGDEEAAPDAGDGESDERYFSKALAGYDERCSFLCCGGGGCCCLRVGVGGSSS